MTGNVRPLGAAVLKSRPGKAERRIFVLDTNVLMHDPTAIFRFEEHDIYIPMTVLEELDAGKKGRAHQSRQTAPRREIVFPDSTAGISTAG